ncbi:MAG: hypothetical protein Q8T09_01765 [Candidatus Melainabacteria bacterium]|nr:hypothetical protein [Candidatus Melainabacteria bacterium]
MDQSFDIFVTCTVMLGFSIVVLLYTKRSSVTGAIISPERLNENRYQSRKRRDAGRNKDLTFSLPPLSCDHEEREYYSARGRQ